MKYVIPRIHFENLKKILEFKDITENDFIVTDGFPKVEELGSREEEEEAWMTRGS